MKKIIYLCFLFLLSFLLYGCKKDNTNDFTFELSYDNESYYVTSYIGNNEEVKIPEKYNKKRVIGIQKDAFNNLNITSIFIPKTITDISILSFTTCEKLNNITVDNDNTRYCSIDGVLYSKSKEILYCFPRAKAVKDNKFEIPEQVTRIGAYAFTNNTKIKHIRFNGNIKTIETNAFSYCSILRTIYIPTSLSYMSSYVFAHTNPELVIHLPNRYITEGWNNKWKDDFDGKVSYDNLDESGEIK